VWLPLPSSGTRSTAALIADFANTFDAVTTFVESADIVRMTRGRRAIERARDRIPEDRRSDASLPALPPIEYDMPQLLVPDEFDRQRAPEGIWWINAWSPQIVDAVGTQRVHAAPWAELRPLANGALLLIATQHRLDPTTAEDAAVLTTLLRELDIRGLQERWRLKA
jgi:hypothetical protein